MAYNGVVELGGRYITFLEPTSGQVEMLIRIQKAMGRGLGEDGPADYIATQIDRLGQLLDALIVPTDLPIVEAMMIAGKIGSVEIIKALRTSWEQNEPKAPTTGPVAAKTRARRS